MYDILNSRKFTAAKLRGFTVNFQEQWVTEAAECLVIPEILSVLSVQVQSFVTIPISVGVETWHTLVGS